MKMVAASKLRRAQENAEKGRPFSEKMNNIILNISNSIIDSINNTGNLDEEIEKKLTTIIEQFQKKGNK